jgi:transcriptional regulator with XRE-family HTH domain
MANNGLMDRPALAAFLRSRRAGLRPDDVGLTSGARRRVAGLRRDEVATLAGMSTDYYVRLEQARGPQPSEQMMASLARALRLTVDERDYLYRTAGLGTPARLPLDSHVSPALLRVFDRLENSPALVLSSLGETLVQNRLGAALLGDHSGFTGFARSSVYRWFTDPRERERYPESDREHQGRAQVANLRAAYGAAGRQSRAGALLDELQRTSPEFRAVWDLHEVAARFADRKTLIHPELGRIDVDCQALFTEDQGQVLLILTATPRSESADKLDLLGVIGQQTFEPHAADPR